MPCGCSGSTASNQKATRREAARTTRGQATPRQPIRFGDAGFTWNGPAGRPAKAEPAKTRG